MVTAKLAPSNRVLGLFIHPQGSRLAENHGLDVGRNGQSARKKKERQAVTPSVHQRLGALTTSYSDADDHDGQSICLG